MNVKGNVVFVAKVQGDGFEWHADIEMKGNLSRDEAEKMCIALADAFYLKLQEAIIGSIDEGLKKLSKNN